MTANSNLHPLSIFNPPLPNMPGQRILWCGLHAAAASLAIANAAQRTAGLTLVVTDDVPTAARLTMELRFFLNGAALDVFNFPDWETLPYDVFSPLPELISQRLHALRRLVDLQYGIMIVPVATLLQRLPPRSYLDAHTIHITVGVQLNATQFQLRLEQAGYRCVAQVFTHGEFAVRGNLLDIFPMGHSQPYRLGLLNQAVDSIRTFDSDTQRSRESVRALRLLPAREIPLDTAGIACFRQAFRSAFAHYPERSLVYREVSNGNAPGGIEYYLPLFYEQTSTLFDYLPPATLAIQFETTRLAAASFLAQVAERHSQRADDYDRPPLPPALLYLNGDELSGALKRSASIRLQTVPPIERPKGFAAIYDFATIPLPSLAPQPAVALQALMTAPRRVLFLAESPGRREQLFTTLNGLAISPQLIADWSTFLASDAPLALTIAPLNRGLCLENIAVIPEASLYGDQVIQARRQRHPRNDADQIIRNLTELHVGAPVVHETHGVGRYLGLIVLTLDGLETEFLVLEYAQGDKLYIPVAALHLISRYSGAPAETAPLHRLGGEQWEKIKKKAVEQVRDIAAELLGIQARRAVTPGFAFTAPGTDYAAFTTAFPFETTPDQQQAIDCVLADMAAPQPMDRVVCGDVGFGKTEVALRAAFQAVQCGKQVAVLVPTTLLAEQHAANFCDRFADWPVQIQSLSRFRTPKEQQQILQDLAAGKLDILIGTHKLLQPEVKFKSLGLVIIDEEHRFGVRHKEQLKALRANVDLLTLTATPIPRTLNLALAGMRDLSIIATPPAARHPIKTFVSPWNESLIIEACQREMKRGGQIYFLHNTVQTIERAAEKLSKLLPTARIEIAHGQMRERDLERVMRDFYHQRFHVLVCSTIIESGIDVPSANTLIIERADQLGLAQLHQLRGRVGRSHHRAYAYLMTAPPNTLTEDAKKRLDAIAALEDLGAGFTLATYDMEIRGVGELLGAAQSGQIQEVGFSLYSDLLERAVQALKTGQTSDLTTTAISSTEIELNLPALLPSDYLPDVHTRLVFYKRIASARSEMDLRELQVELTDRFGLLPTATKNLFAITAWRLQIQPLGIRKIEAGNRGGRIQFAMDTRIDPQRVVQLLQNRPQEFKLVGGDSLRFISDLANPDTRLQRVQHILDALII